jgi:predicted nucleotidyltransferase
MGIQVNNFKSALVVGTVRDVSANLVSDLLRIVNALEEILPTYAYLVESDSSDNTVAKLDELGAKDSRIRYSSLGVIAITISDRIERIRYCRNKYVSEIRNNPLYKDVDLIIVADLDGINTKVDAAVFKLALDLELPWDALGANQSALYYDIFALRHPLWSPNDWASEVAWLEPFLGKKLAKRHSMTDKMIHIPDTFPPIPVESAFGGLCIYRRWVFDQFDYLEESVEPRLENEHVTIHRKLRAAGGQIYIHPGLINSKWTTHSLGSRPFILFLNSIAHLFPFNLLLPILRKALPLLAKHS